MGSRFHGAGDVHLGWGSNEGLPRASPSCEGHDPFGDGKSNPGVVENIAERQAKHKGLVLILAGALFYATVTLSFF